MTDARMEAFDAIAGAMYGVMTMQRHIEAAAPAGLATFSFCWDLLGAALVRGDTPEALPLNLLRGLAEVPDAERRQELERSFSANWGTWLALLLLAPQPAAYWQRHCLAFPAENGEESLLRHVTKFLFIDGGRRLYDAASLSDEHQKSYGDPASCMLVKLGLFLKERAEDGQFEHRELAQQWREVVRTLLPQPVDRPLRGFARAWPRFEDFVLALLYVTEWLAKSGWEDIKKLIAGYAVHEEERMTPEQILLGGALYGWLRGYRKAAGAIEERETRRRLSGQAMALAMRRGSDTGASEVVPAHFYATADGTPIDMDLPLLRCTLMEETDTIILRKKPDPESKRLVVVSAEQKSERLYELSTGFDTLLTPITFPSVQTVQTK